MDENGRALLNTVIGGNFVVKDDKLMSDFLFHNYGVLAVDLSYGNNRVIYEKGLLLKDKFNSEFNIACKELNI